MPAVADSAKVDSSSVENGASPAEKMNDVSPANTGEESEESQADSSSVDAAAASRSPGVEVYDAAFSDFTRGSYSLAREGFEEFLARYPDTDLSDNASYWIGETWYAQGNYQEAVRHFDAVLRTYPDGDIVPGALLKSSNCHLELGKETALWRVIDAWFVSIPIAMRPSSLNTNSLKLGSAPSPERTMPKIPALRVARSLEQAFRPHDLCSVDSDYHVFVVAYSGSYVEHSHPADEFILILEGELTIGVGGESRCCVRATPFSCPRAPSTGPAAPAAPSPW